MDADRGILLLDGESWRSQALADRLYAMGFRVRRAKTPEEALRLGEERDLGFGAALVPPDIPVADLGAALRSLESRIDGGALTWIAVGRRPDDERLQRLRDAGVRLALWDPFDERTLRFQLNRALAGLREIAPRRELRAPLDLPAQVWSGGRKKAATVYTLSAAGAYFETPRPSLKGASVSVEIPLGPGVTVDGRVVYTNVPGNLRKHALPVGMAVAFLGLEGGAEQTIRRQVAARALSLVV